MLSLDEWGDWILMREAYEALRTSDAGGPRVESVLESLEQKLTEAQGPLARALRDTLFVMCLGEARHAYSRVWETDLWGEIPDTHEREAAFRIAPAYSPERTLPQLEDYFNLDWLSSSIGGRKWAEIAHGASLYGKLSDQLFLDHCCDLEHNGGDLLSKTSVTVVLPNLSIPKSSKYLRNYLFKRYSGHGLDQASVQMLYPSTVTVRLVNQVMRLLYREPLAWVDTRIRARQIEYPVFKWGDKCLTVKVPPRLGWGCPTCGRRFKTESVSRTLVMIDGNPLSMCRGCASDIYDQCQTCGTHFHKGEMISSPVLVSRGPGNEKETLLVCQKCAEEKIHACRTCGELIHPEQDYKVDGVHFHAGKCTKDGAYRCPRCACLHVAEVVPLRKLGLEEMCQSCYDETVFTCPCCGEERSRYNATATYLDTNAVGSDPVRVCDNCIATRGFAPCVHCGKYSSKASFVKVQGERHPFCPTCINRLGIVQCVNCKSWIKGGMYRPMLSGSVCLTCYPKIRGLQPNKENLPILETAEPEPPPKPCPACGSEVPDNGVCNCLLPKRGQKKFVWHYVDPSEIKATVAKPKKQASEPISKPTPPPKGVQ